MRIEHPEFINSIINELKSIKNCVVIGKMYYKSTKCIEYGTFISENANEPDKVVYDMDSLIIMYSSGTTGKNLSI